MFPRRIRSYVLREGRMTSGQQRAIDRLWSRYGLSVEAGELDYCRCFGRSAPTVLEIGFGMGDSFLEMAAADPDVNFIGVEVHRPGVGHLLGLAESSGAENLRVYNADGVEVLNQSIPTDSLERVQIFFPDPWPKKNTTRDDSSHQPLRRWWRVGSSPAVSSTRQPTGRTMPTR